MACLQRQVDRYAAGQRRVPLRADARGAEVEAFDRPTAHRAADAARVEAYLPAAGGGDHAEAALGAFDPRLARPVEISVLDGVRMAFANGDTVHFRQSGNAPEMRVYVETGSAEGTETLLGEMMGKLAASF